MHKSDYPYNPHATAAQSNSFINGALIGAIIGVALGVMMAPAKGSENRKKFKQFSEKAIDVTKELVENGQAVATPLLEEATPIAKEIAEKAVPEVKKAMSSVIQLAEPELEEMKKRINKNNKNAAARKFFRGIF